MSPRIVIAHDFCEVFGGAERVTAEIARVFPDAPVVSILGRSTVAERMGIADRVSYLFRGRERLLANYRTLAPLYFEVIRTARLDPADLLISSNYAYVQGLRAPPGGRHLCFTWGPFRHLWSQQSQYAAELAFGPAARAAFSAYAVAARRLDRRASRNVDLYATSSPYTAELLKRAYGRDSELLEPPIDCRRFHPDGAPPDDYFLFVGRLTEAYKRPSLVVEAFSRMPDLKLKVAGDGPDMARVRKIAGPNVEFLGHLTDDGLVDAMQRCRAAVFPSIDDFGLVPLEVNACGRPAIAYAGGGAMYTVKDGTTGLHFHEQTVGGVMGAVRRFDEMDFDAAVIREHALHYDCPSFEVRLRGLVDRFLALGPGLGHYRGRAVVPALAEPVGDAS